MTDEGVTRRGLLGAVLPLLAMTAPAGRAAAALSAIAARETLRVDVLLPPSGDDDDDANAVAQGLTLGADESMRTASLFGLRVEVVERRVHAPEDAARVAHEILSRGAPVLVVGLGADRCRSIDAIAAERRGLVIAVDCASDVPASDGCAASLASVSPAAATIRRARSAYARRSPRADESHARIALWHHSLRRFGAAQLNERFRRRFERGMSSPAWAGWAAMKIVTEAALRSGSTDARGIATYLMSRAARFDGHKGEPIVVDPRTGELRQPLYVLAEAADRREGVAAELSIAECYEPIGPDTRARRSCAAPSVNR